MNLCVETLFIICDQSWITNYNIGIWMRSVHLVSPFFLIFISLFHSERTTKLCIYFMITMFTLFLLLGDCWMSRLENRLCNDRMCIVDLVIESLGIDIYSLSYERQNKIRYSFTYIIATIFFVTLLVIYYYRFIKKKLKF